MKVKDLLPDVWAADELKVGDMNDYEELKRALKRKPRAQTVVVKNNQTGEIVGKRTIYQK